MSQRAKKSGSCLPSIPTGRRREFRVYAISFQRSAQRVETSAASQVWGQPEMKGSGLALRHAIKLRLRQGCFYKLGVSFWRVS